MLPVLPGKADMLQHLSHSMKSCVWGRLIHSWCAYARHACRSGAGIDSKAMSRTNCRPTCALHADTVEGYHSAGAELG